MRFFANNLLIILLLGIFLFQSNSVFAQPAEGCENPLTYVFPFPSPEIEMTNVVYGENKTVDGVNQVLTIDVYELKGDMREKRPVIIWVHGGAFIFGNRNDMRSFAEAYASIGYVTASIDYRLFPLSQGIPDSLEAFDAAIKAVGDLKAAIRHLRKDAATDNRFRIDPNHIIIGGVSAGAITAIHAAYLDEDDTAAPYLQEIIDINGGIEGSSGDAENLQYSSEVEAVINLSGAIYRTEWINSDEPPLTSFHAQDDDVVPYFDDFARVAGIEIMPLKGTGIIHDHADRIGLKNYFLGPEMGGHSALYSAPEYEEERTEFTLNANNFIREIICENTSSIARSASLPSPVVYPVPAAHSINIEGDLNDKASYWVLTDLQGRQVKRNVMTKHGITTIDREGLPAGMYILRILDQDGHLTLKPARVVFH